MKFPTGAARLWGFPVASSSYPIEPFNRAVTRLTARSPENFRAVELQTGKMQFHGGVGTRIEARPRSQFSTRKVAAGVAFVKIHITSASGINAKPPASFTYAATSSRAYIRIRGRLHKISRAISATSAALQRIGYPMSSQRAEYLHVLLK